MSGETEKCLMHHIGECEQAAQHKYKKASIDQLFGVVCISKFKKLRASIATETCQFMSITSQKYTAKLVFSFTE